MSRSFVQHPEPSPLSWWVGVFLGILIVQISLILGWLTDYASEPAWIWLLPTISYLSLIILFLIGSAVFALVRKSSAVFAEGLRNPQ